MTGNRRNPNDTGGQALNGDVMVLSHAESLPPATSGVDLVREKLRQRWELASVLNFLHVFKPLIRNAPKICAEEIETALVEQNNNLTQLHIALLEGIRPGSKILKGSDDWMITLNKILGMWWPWVAEGDFPLTAVKGEEIAAYKKLDPTSRLVVLKALCEVRAEQNDVLSYINETIKDGTQLSTFRKDELVGDGNGVTFWYDGNETIGHRLYKEVRVFESKRVKGKCTVPSINCKWETLATNLEEFKTVVNEFSSSKVKLEVTLSKAVEADVIPILQKYWKKKQKAQLRQQREQMLLNGFRSSGITRSCRNQKRVDYRFDNYDKAITEAIQYANKRKIDERQRKEDKFNQSGKRAANRSYNSDTNSRDGESSESDSEMKQTQDSDDPSHEEHEEKNEGDSNGKGNRNHQKVQRREPNKHLVQRFRGLRFSRRLAGIPGHTHPENVNLGAKNRLRQRPSLNTAMESLVVPDSEDEKSSGDME